VGGGAKRFFEGRAWGRKFDVEFLADRLATTKEFYTDRVFCRAYDWKVVQLAEDETGW
jgi:hypothetical protein